MTITTEPTANASILLIVHNGQSIIGRALHDVDGFWKYCPPRNGWIEAHNLRKIADLLDGLNAPYEKELAAYFDSLPKEMSREPQDDGFPF